MTVLDKLEQTFRCTCESTEKERKNSIGRAQLQIETANAASSVRGTR